MSQARSFSSNSLSILTSSISTPSRSYSSRMLVMMESTWVFSKSSRLM